MLIVIFVVKTKRAPWFCYMNWIW